MLTASEYSVKNESVIQGNKTNEKTINGSERYAPYFAALCAIKNILLCSLPPTRRENEGRSVVSTADMGTEKRVITLIALEKMPTRVYDPTICAIHIGMFEYNGFTKINATEYNHCFLMTLEVTLFFEELIVRRSREEIKARADETMTLNRYAIKIARIACS